MADSPLCPCGHRLQDATCNLRVLLEGDDPFQINEFPVTLCPNCGHTVAAEAGFARISQVLGLAPGAPWPRCRVFTDKPTRTGLTKDETIG